MATQERQPHRRTRERRGSRRWCLPPAITREPGEVLDGSYILEEFSGELALVLWTAVRDVTLWATTPAGRRSALFSAGAEAARREANDRARMEPALDLSIATLATVVSHGSETNPEVIAVVCMDVARWARQRGAMGSAVAFAQAGALAHPVSASASLGVGTLALEWGRFRRAETWLRRAVGLARRSGDWASYGSACVAMGQVFAHTGRAAQACRYLQQAARLARRQGLRNLRGEALHGLLRLKLAAGELEQATELARAAQRAYGQNHARKPELQQDIAALLIERGEYARALALLRKQAGRSLDAAGQALFHALFAHAAAGTGDAAAYEPNWAESWALLDDRATGTVAAEVLRQLGTAAALVGDWLSWHLVMERFAMLGGGPQVLRKAAAVSGLRPVA